MSADRKTWHFGVLPFTGAGHLNPLIALARELADRGHAVTFFQQPRIECQVRQAGLEFVALENGSSGREERRAQGSAGIWPQLCGLRLNLQRIIRDIEFFLRETPPALKARDVNALIVDEIALAGPTVAQIAGLPYFVVSVSVPHHSGWQAFPRNSGYRLSHSRISWLERAVLEISVLRMRGPIRWAIDRYRRSLGLGPVRKLQQTFPMLAHIAQLPSDLDFPRKALPANFHYAGPLTSSLTRPPVDFPWEKLDGRPLVYASLGTTKHVQPEIFRMIAESCRNLDVQLVISLGGRYDPAALTGLPENALAVKFAPQLEILKLARLVITHAGANTVFEALAEGKPMIAIPLAFDQPAIAARLARLNLGLVLPVMRLSAERIRAAVTALLGNPGYGEAAVRMQHALQRIRGPETAANLMETALAEYAANRASKVSAKRKRGNKVEDETAAALASCSSR